MSVLSLQALLHIARAGLIAQETGIDVIANNISNLNTVGYRQSRAEFQELLSRQLQAPQSPNNRVSGQAEGTFLAATQRMFGQGQIVASDMPWSMAIEGEGFFQVQRADGSMAYTRNGDFRLDGLGRLINPDGYLLAPTVTLPPDTEEHYITPDGVIMARRRGETQPRAVATVLLARFNNPSGLDSVGDNLFVATPASGDPQLGQPRTNGLGQIIGQALESSNVDLAEQMTELITGQRAYALMARALNTADEMLNLANQLRA